MQDRTDLDRLRAAFAELSTRGFGADFDVAWKAFTRQDAAAETPRGPKGFVYSYAQAYTGAFFAEEGWGVAAQPMPALIKDEIEAMKAELMETAGLDPDEHTELVAAVERGDIDPEDLDDDHLALEEAWRKIGDNDVRADAALEHERIHPLSRCRNHLHLAARGATSERAGHGQATGGFSRCGTVRRARPAGSSEVTAQDRSRH